MRNDDYLKNSTFYKQLHFNDLFINFYEKRTAAGNTSSDLIKCTLVNNCDFFEFSVLFNVFLLKEVCPTDKILEIKLHGECGGLFLVKVIMEKKIIKLCRIHFTTFPSLLMEFLNWSDCHEQAKI